MPDYERSRVVKAGVDDVFAYVSDIANLPDYLEQMKDARPTEGEAIVVRAVVDLPDQGPTEVESEAWFRVREDVHRIEWGSEGENDYHGWLDVTADGGPESTISMAVHTLGHEDDDDEVNRAIDAALDNVVQAVEAG